MAHGGKPKGKIIDALPAALKGRLKKPRLNQLTFADLETIGTALNKFHNVDPTGFHKKACGQCTKWQP